MRVTHIFRNFPNKNQPYNQVLIERLLNKGVDCRVFNFGKAFNKNQLRVDSFEHRKSLWPIYFFRSLSRFHLFKKFHTLSQRSLKQDIFYFGRFSKLLNSSPDVIHIHHLQILTIDFLTFLKLTNIKCVVSIRGGDVLVRPFRSDKDMDFLVKAVGEIKNVHLVSQHLKTNLNRLTSTNINSFVIRRSAEIDERSNTPIEVEPTKIITIGRIHWTKGYKYALEALSLLKLDGIEFHYHICGNGSIEQTDELRFFIKHFDLQNEVILEGHLSSQQLDTIMTQSTIYLQASLSEGIPNTLLRALCLRIPIVTTNVGGIPEVFENGNDGIMVEKTNSQQLYKALKKLLLNKELQQNIRMNKASKLSKPDEEIEKYLNMYNSIL